MYMYIYVYIYVYVYVYVYHQKDKILQPLDTPPFPPDSMFEALFGEPVDRACHVHEIQAYIYIYIYIYIPGGQSTRNDV